MPLNIDYSFIGKLEGNCLLQGYVPKPKSSQSGVTVATGFDLGARNENDLRKLGITGNLLNRLIPYLGLQGQVAANAVKRSPLSISSHECRFLEVIPPFLTGFESRA